MDSAQQLFGTAVDREAAGDLRSAKALYGKVIDTGDEEYAPAAAVRLARLLETTGDLAGARSAYRVAADSGHPLHSRLAARRLAGTATRRYAAEPKLLEPVANPDLYRRNAFRLSGLPVDATARDLRRRGEQLRAAERLGALVEEVDPGAVREALTLVRDPARRIVEELFWLWENQSPEASGGGPALHDAAVLAHAQALDAGDDADPALWRRAYEYWGAVVEEAECWQWLADRVAQLADRRISGQTVETMRAELPRAVLAPQAALAARAAEAGADDIARAHVESLRRSGFPIDVITEALGAATKHLTARVRSACRKAERLTVADPEDGADAVDALLDKVEPLLKAVRLVLGENSNAYGAAADAVALSVNTCVVRYVNEGHDFGDAFEQLEEVLDIAISPQARAAVEPSYVAAGSNVLGELCEDAADRATALPEEGARIAESLLDEIQPTVAALAARVDPDDPLYRECLDGVALCAVSCLGSFHGATGDDETTLAGLSRALDLAVGGEARSAIEVVRIGLRSVCWFCQAEDGRTAVLEAALHGEVDRSELPRVTWKTAGVVVPRCTGCRAAHDRRDRLDSGWAAAPIPVLGVPLVLGGTFALFDAEFGPFSALLFVFVSVFVLFSAYGALVNARQRRAEERRAHLNAALSRFPPIQQLELLGWRLGARPPGL
ncbi:tetratricopeptide repeat protein [Allokutzneria sp. A3M-2-11 16]|uniref:tetratricopeptide repeat protein n=1 Tax=Allokutzneria sp. A3M-2-11 16 TaxID=2962043 RepID=UPI0020B8EFF1|nr:tetratricopeptide repeat protein [Allokutzneria sp. A3M-2-11 16]MCP3804376.1 tetratricopeptide repeat protein [Allokutzneria sp. A3M-2-11 16]